MEIMTKELKIPTAEEFLKQRDCINSTEDFFNDVQPIDLIEFAKLHTQAALKAAAESAKIINKPRFPGDYNPVVDEDSILDAYPLNNVK